MIPEMLINVVSPPVAAPLLSGSCQQNINNEAYLSPDYQNRWKAQTNRNYGISATQFINFGKRKLSEAIPATGIVSFRGGNTDLAEQNYYNEKFVKSPTPK